MSETPEPFIYQLKVVLLDVSPMIWRRLLVCDDSTITDLHYILQINMGWSDDHLNRIRIHGKQYGIARFGYHPDSCIIGRLGISGKKIALR